VQNKQKNKNKNKIKYTTGVAELPVTAGSMCTNKIK
jgi:hypothetical protein